MKWIMHSGHAHEDMHMHHYRIKRWLVHAQLTHVNGDIYMQNGQMQLGDCTSTINVCKWGRLHEKWKIAMHMHVAALQTEAKNALKKTCNYGWMNEWILFLKPVTNTVKCNSLLSRKVIWLISDGVGSSRDGISTWWCLLTHDHWLWLISNGSQLRQI